MAGKHVPRMRKSNNGPEMPVEGRHGMYARAVEKEVFNPRVPLVERNELLLKIVAEELKPRVRDEWGVTDLELSRRAYSLAEEVIKRARARGLTDDRSFMQAISEIAERMLKQKF